MGYIFLNLLVISIHSPHLPKICGVRRQFELFYSCVCVCECERGRLSCRQGRGLDFISDLRPSASSRQLLARSKHNRPACPFPMPHGIYGEVTTAAGETLPPNTLRQSAANITYTCMLTDGENRCMEILERIQMRLCKHY